MEIISSFIDQLENADQIEYYPDVLQKTIQETSPVDQKSELKEDEWVVVKSSLKQRQEQIAQIQHPLFNKQQALKMLNEMSDFL